MRNPLSDVVIEMKPSGIRKFFDIVSERKDVISLGVGEPDFVTPWEIRDAGITAIKKGYTQYTSNKGMPALRKEISEYIKNSYSVDFSADDYIVTVGASEAIDLALRASVNAGDEVLIPDPSYVSYKPCVELNGGVPVAVPCDGANGFKLTKENLEKVLSLLKNFVKNEDHFYSEENQKYLQESIREFKEGKVVSFSDEEWEKFVNAQNIQ